MGELIGTLEAAKRLGLSRVRVIQFIHDGRLPATKIANAWVVDSDDLQKIKSQQRGRPSKASKARPRKSPKKKPRRERPDGADGH